MILPTMAWGSELKPGIDIGQVVKQSVEEPPRLVVEAEGVYEPGEYELTATYFKGGEFFLTESIHFTATDKSKAYVELLMLSAEEKQEFLTGTGYPTATLEHPDGTVEELQWKDLVELSLSWDSSQGSLVLPVSVTTSGSRPPADGIGLVFAASSTCLDNCDLEYQWCEDSCNGDGYCLDWCDYQRDVCRDNCCPFVSEYTVTTLDQETFTGSTKCLEGLYTFQGRDYTHMERIWKHTEYRETEACDGSTSTVVIDVTYSTDYCWKQTAYSCGSPDPSSGSYCRY